MIGNKFINTIFFIVNLFLTLLAPEQYSYVFCFAIFCLFLIQNIIFFSSKEYSNILSFEFFFFFSFGMCCFIYPIIYYPIKPDIGFFSFYFNKNIISYSTALAGLSFSSYILGMSLIKKRYNNLALINNIYISKKFVKILLFISLISFLGYILTGGLYHLKNVYKGEADINEVGLFSYFKNINSITILLLSMFVFKIKSNYYRNIILFYLLLVVVLILLTGSRTIVLSVISILLVSYSLFIKKIPKIGVTLFMILGSFFMNFVMVIREGDASDLNKQKYSNFDIFSDLVWTNRNLYVLVDFADHNFYANFIPTLTSIFSPIPGFTSILNSFGYSNDLMMGGSWTTFLEFGSGSTFGLGTNIVGEMYFGFGIYGVIFISFLLGLLIMYLKNRLQNKYYFIIYFLFVSQAIFYPRAFYLVQLRTIVWAIAIIYIYELLSSQVFIKKK